MKQKMTKDTIPEGFTLILSLVDAIPVLFCGFSLLAITKHFPSSLFLISSWTILLSGTIKVLWKIIVALRQKNIWWMFVQMRIFMPIGFLLLILSLFIDHNLVNTASIISALTQFPSCIFFLCGFIGMGLMVVFAIKLDSSDLKSNWIEQITNGIAQICFFIGLMLL